MKNVVFFAVLMLFLLATAGFAAEEESRRELERIKQKMAQTASSLAEQKDAEQDLLRDLSVVATVIKQSNSRISALEAKQRDVSRQLTASRAELQRSQQQMTDLKRRLHRRFVALYKEGETGPLKLFFSSSSPMELAQQYQYLSKVLGHDRELLESFRQQIDRQGRIEAQLVALQTEQKALLAREKRNRRSAEDGRRLQSEILQRVRKDRQRLTEELKQLEARAHRLESLLRELKPAPAPPRADDALPFAARKGRLPWPVEGQVVIGFGTQHNAVLGSVLESKGIEMSSRSDQPVRAVAPGRVVFANWFKGYGNMMILAHDQGYHTLYAQLESLAGNVGDQVEQGEKIGRTGEAGESGLYFEIRHNGSAIDPMPWLGAN